MNKKLAIGVAGGALGLAVLFGGVALAHSSDGPRAAVSGTAQVPTDTPARTDDWDDGRHDAGRDDDGRGDDGRGDDDRVPAGQSGLIPVEQAIETARQQVPRAKVEDVELETEHGRLVWDVELTANGTEYKIDVDAKTGEVLRVRQDD